MSKIHEAAEKFSTHFPLPSINVGTIVTRVGVMAGGDEPEAPVIVLDVPDRNAALTPAQALSIAASLQALSVHLMESEPRKIRRSTEPGAPSFEEGI